MLRFFEPEAELICRTSSPVDYLKFIAMHETLFSNESQAPSFDRFQLSGFSESKIMLASLIQGHPIATKDTNVKHGSKRQKTSHAATAVESPTRRNQKLGDRITALQQLVSPFGKTDTASVLQEANVYIKILHEQIKALTSPYFNKGFKEEKDDDLQSRGLCLVPISKITNLCDHAPLT
ncbi:transcription factor bHLH111-like isoform X2 [Dioscorea cayenensis subsp. rotundata]|uniref:Transcription factor bHLH111-like isoform X2 n=1 Tax=Dioscorea cayennensis subsp. rotundata TaxID=55577 RepID=A0AB40BPK3_DIOCR|nr:transcription factor bHLH111-like isoform X2 [Dioscorea cayenensis subsp. rotundata]